MRVACMQVALHAPIAGMAGLALGLDFSKKLLQYATTALWHTAKVPLKFNLIQNDLVHHWKLLHHDG